ncbi:protein artichoke-like [Diachasmimorpha longicaudata]|uniref:protein artichoke-like n=1 Tax=Diachasmimorpha longicaudata TaxID=58733 RepID=UPI0030B8BEA1
MEIFIGLISFAFCLSSTRGQEEICSNENWDFRICKKSNRLTKVIHDARFFSGKNFYKTLDNISAIEEDAFTALNLVRLILTFNEPDNNDGSLLHSVFVKPNTFGGLTGLRMLSIDGARLDTNGDILNLPKSLVSLTFRKCGFTEVPTEMLTATPYLQELSLEGNVIRSIKPNAFASLTNLKHLDLSRNGVKKLHEGCFNQLRNLESLKLIQNYIAPVPALFRGLQKLKKLYITDAFNILGFQPHLLEDLPTLVVLYLGFNRISYLQFRMFDAARGLEHLSLYGNLLQHIPRGVFEKLTSLNELSLADNRIETIEPGAFSGLNLTRLVLSLNNIKIIEAGAFSNLNVRNRLDLRKNLISEVKPGAFTKLSTRQLDLTENKLTRINADDFAGLIARELDLSSNQITTIAPKAFTYAIINEVGLFFNPITEVDRKLWGLQDFEEIMKRNCDVMKAVLGIHLVTLALSVNANFPSSLNTSDHTLYVEDNTIIRVSKIGYSNRLSMTLDTQHIAIAPLAFQDSDVKDLHLTFNTSTNLTRNVGNSYGQISLQPASLLGLDLDTLSLSNVDVTFNRDAMTPIRSLNHLSLISCNIVEVPTPLLMSFPKLGSLILSGHNMSIVHHNAFQPLGRLWYLNLSSNRITTLESGCFNGLEELERLDLSNNSFTIMPAVFNGLIKLMELHIRDCPYLRIIDIRAFIEIPTLVSLTVSHTAVDSLEPGIFNNLGRLSWLQLENNRISRVPRNLFNKLESLQYLFLDNNEILRTDSHAFAGLNLRYLGLSYQNPGSRKQFHPQRVVIENGTFSDLIADIVSMVGTSNPDIRPGAFDGLSTGLLDLRCVGIGKIDTEMFSGVRAKKLDLRMNGISEINKNAFKGVIGDEVDLSLNPIQITDKENWDISESLYINI